MRPFRTIQWEMTRAIIVSDAYGLVWTASDTSTSLGLTIAQALGRTTRRAIYGTSIKPTATMELLGRQPSKFPTTHHRAGMAFRRSGAIQLEYTALPAISSLAMRTLTFYTSHGPIRASSS